MIPPKEILIYVILKFILAIIFSLGGIICYSDNTCLISRQTDVAFIGVGIGIVCSTIIIVTMHHFLKDVEYDKLFRKTLIFFLVIFSVAMLLLVIGSGLTDRYMIGYGVLGIGFGILFSSAIALAIMLCSMAGFVRHQ